MAWSLAVAALAGGCFVEDGLPGGPGPAEGHEPGTDAPADPPVFGALGGEYEAELRTVRCEGDCVGASSILGPTTFCDVGELDIDTVDVWHDEMALTMDVSQGRLQGSVDEDGAFEVEGRGTESGGQLDIDMTGSGRFMGRHVGFAGTVRFSVVGTQDDDHVDCRGELEVIATWRSDGCRDDADACPDGWPICVDDGCYAGADGDPCRSDDECTGGLRCNVQVCRTPAAAGGACEDDQDCASGLHCVREACSAGEPGDACVFADQCPSGFCVDEVCTDGGTGAACNGSFDCTSGICIAGACQDGTAGSACGSSSDCTAGSCHEGACTSGAVGEPCGSADECESGFCVDGTCTAGAPGDPCGADWDCAGDYACYEEHCYLGAAGDPCNVGSQCASGICYWSECSSGTDGAACTWDSDCAAGFSCIEDTCAAS